MLQEKLKNTYRAGIVSSILLATSAHANTLTGTIDLLQVHTPTNGAYVHLVGAPTFDGTGCSQPWAIGDLDDEKFMIYVWPMLVSAKHKGVSVTVGVSGCFAGYPRILWVQVNAT